MQLMIVSRRDPGAGEAHAVAADIQEEIRFLIYRLEVLESRPDSPARDAHIRATLARLDSLMPSDDRRPERRAA